jgi:hypothetical protein
MILAGIDPCFSCNDRTVIVRRERDGGLASVSGFDSRKDASAQGRP